MEAPPMLMCANQRENSITIIDKINEVPLKLRDPSSDTANGLNAVSLGIHR